MNEKQPFEQTTPWRRRPYRLMVYSERDERCIAHFDLTEDQAAAIGDLISPPGDGFGCYELVGLAHFQMEPRE